MPHDGYTRLAWAVVYQAAKDTARGSDEAEAWLWGPNGKAYCDALGLEYTLVESWLRGNRAFPKKANRSKKRDFPAVTYEAK